MKFKNLLQHTLRDLRSGDLTMLIAAVALAVGALCAVSLFADRLSGAFARDAKQLLGGDAVVVSDQPLPSRIEALAKQYGLQTVSTVVFATMASHQGSIKLVALKAVPSGYPLRGNLKIDAGVATRDVPKSGEVWVENSLLAALDVRLGDDLILGESHFKITHTVASEPDRGVGFLNFAPRVMMNASDLAETQLVQPASRVTYRLAVASRDPAVLDGVASFNKSVTSLLPQMHGVRLDSLESGRPEVREILGGTEKFLNLVALLCALVCAAAVAISARGFAAKRIDDCALRRVLGQSQLAIATGFALEFLLVGLFASCMGCVLGLGLQQVFVSVLTQLMDTDLPEASAWPYFFGAGVGVTLLFGFGLPPVLQLAGTPPLRVLRRDVGALKAAPLATLVLAVLGFVVLLLMTSKDRTLGLITTGGFAAALLLFAALAYAALHLLSHLQARGVIHSQSLRLATRQLLARRVQTVVQVASLSIGLLALFLLLLLRSDLLANWQKAKPIDAPNRMVINVLPEQANDFKSLLDKAAKDSRVANSYDWYPMIRGRLVAVNDEWVSAANYDDERAKRLVEREFNLSNSAALPAHNQLTAGKWTTEESDAVSVEEGLAKTLHLSLGDRLRFDVAGVSIESRITSLRKVDWQSMRANFFVLYPKAVMRDVPTTYLAAFKVLPAKPEQAYAFDNQLVRTFPNITLIDLTQSLNELASVVRKVTRAVEALFAFTLAAGVLVLLATLQAASSHTQRDFALMRALGASRLQLRRVQALQLAGIGVLAGFLAANAALLLAWALAKWVFHFDWVISPALPIMGSVVGGLLTLGVGRWALRGILNQPVTQSLRAAQ